MIGQNLLKERKKNGIFTKNHDNLDFSMVEGRMCTLMHSQKWFVLKKNAKNI